MTAEVLVMCSACGRGQAPAAQCIVCGEPLPDALESKEGPRAVGRPAAVSSMGRSTDKIAVDLGGGQRVVIGPEALELQGAGPADRFTLASLTRVRVEERRIWALVPIAMALSFSVGFVTSWPARIVLLAALAASVWAFARRRRFALHFERADGAAARVELRAVRAGAMDVAAERRAVGAVAEELERRGVRVVR